MTTTSLQPQHRAHLAFHLTGARTEGALEDTAELRPALFAAYSDLTRLRYDFPVVLLRSGARTPFESLSRIVERTSGSLALPGPDGERTRKLLLRHELAIRRLVSDGSATTLGRLWDLAIAVSDYDPDAAATLARARRALEHDGQVFDCDADLPVRLFIRAWRFAQKTKTRDMEQRIERLTLALTDILRADHAHSEAACAPAKLQAAVGTAFEDAFDFQRMASILGSALPASTLREVRRTRIQNVLETLRKQRFFAADEHVGTDREPYVFVYTSATDVHKAYSERMSQMIELVKALAIAELETRGEYDEARHDAVFDAFGANGLPADELARFPDYLLWLPAPGAEDLAEATALLSGNAPVKVLVQWNDLLEKAPGGQDMTLSLRSKQLADLAMGLATVYVLQSSASHLVRLREAVLKGLLYDGPALFSVYSGAANAPAPNAYLLSAAAMESRAFPAFTYDPAAGTTWAERFSIDMNPQPERDWPVQTLAYESADHARAATQLEFTVSDFMSCDPRYARHCAKVPAASVNGHLTSVREWLEQPPGAESGQLPALTMVDRDNTLQRVIVDARAIEEAKRCRAIWRSLQELGGIHNSHAERLLARERAAWEEVKQQEIEALARSAKPAAEAPAEAGTPSPDLPPQAAKESLAAPVAEAKASDDAYIETPRCTTCEECVRINDKLFAYDANKQAYIADIAAGTFRQIVEAAEACQVSIIHPGKPRDASEPGLDELVVRAEAFR